jgi:hypothetical protein
VRQFQHERVIVAQGPFGFVEAGVGFADPPRVDAVDTDSDPSLRSSSMWPRPSRSSWARVRSSMSQSSPMIANNSSATVRSATGGNVWRR